MKSIAISASARTVTGSKNASHLRKEGNVPGVVYGGKENLHFSIKELDLRKLTRTSLAHIVELDIDGNKVNALLKEVQYHPVSDRAIHIDFIELVKGAKTTVKLAVQLVGQSIGVRLGGKLAQPLRSLVVSGVPADMPESVEVDITELQVGDAVRIRDIKIDGCEIIGRGDSVVTAVKTARTVVAAAEEAEVAEAAPAEGEAAPAEG